MTDGRTDGQMDRQKCSYSCLVAAKNDWRPEVNIQHTSKSSWNWQVKQDWWETSGNFLRKWPKTEILTYFEALSGRYRADMILSTDRRTDKQMDGQCETSIPPLNFVEAGGIISSLRSDIFLCQTHVQCVHTFCRWIDGCCVGIHQRTGTTFCK